MTTEPVPSTDRAAAAELAAVLEPHFYEAYRLGKYSPEGYLPPWHDTDQRAQAWPEAMRGAEELLASGWLATQLAAAVHTALTGQRAAFLAAAQSSGVESHRTSSVLRWMDWHIENPQAREAAES